MQKISVITVVFNGEDTIEDTIKSVLAQQNVNIELIIIDGGSKDRTVDIVKKYSDRIHYWVSEKDKGIYDAMNKGWNKAAGDSYILFLGSGDKIIKLPDLSDFQGDEIIYGNVYVDESRIFNAKADFRLKMGNTLHHQALLINKNAHPDPPFSLKYKVYSDFDFNQRLMKEGRKFIYTKELIAYALPGGVSSRFNYKESLEIIKKNY